MVSLRLRPGTRAVIRCTAAVAGALIVLACRRDRPATANAAPPGGGSAESRIAELVRAQYRAHDVEAAGAWVWTGPDGLNWVMIDAQSAVQGIVQGRAELWLANEQQAAVFGKSEALPSAAELGAYAFQDLTGDTIPDFFGYVADSSGVSYPVFFPGARPGMNEEIALAAPGWHFATDDDHLPQTFGAAGHICALQLWADDSLPDNSQPGWRWLALHRGGELGAPARTSPDCSAGGNAAGVQPRPAVP